MHLVSALGGRTGLANSPFVRSPIFYLLSLLNIILCTGGRLVHLIDAAGKYRGTERMLCEWVQPQKSEMHGLGHIITELLVIVDLWQGLVKQTPPPLDKSPITNM